MAACYLHDTARAELLIRNGADVNAVDAIGRSPLTYAALGCCVPGCNIDTALHVISQLLDASDVATVNAIDVYGRTAVFWGGLSGHARVFAVLVLHAKCELQRPIGKGNLHHHLQRYARVNASSASSSSRPCS